MQRRLWISLVCVMAMCALVLTSACAPKKTISSKPVECPKVAPVAEVPMVAPGTSALDEQALAEQQRRQAQMAWRAAKSDFLNEYIYFAYDRSDLQPAAQAKLRRKADFMRKYPQTTVIVEGHCDERGTTEYNLALGERRAQSAKNFLVDLGIDASRISTISYGEERPMDPRHIEEAWAKNRRGQFLIE